MIGSELSAQTMSFTALEIDANPRRSMAAGLSASTRSVVLLANFVYLTVAPLFPHWRSP
ncbi:hypothetical protein [Gemmatimonas sp.]|uniref:hypothetical protein n=1 Tax=Gemmatimonas sp. TaxID=1962908 RepID=UPI003565A22F